MKRTVQGKCIASVKAQISSSFWGWIFQFVGVMKILSPESLMDEYKKRAEEVEKM